MSFDEWVLLEKKATSVVAKFSRKVAGEKQTLVPYRGDSLSAFLYSYGISPKWCNFFLRANRLSGEHELQPGMLVRIPKSKQKDSFTRHREA